MARRLVVLLALAALACRRVTTPTPPRVNFLVLAGDSTFWVRSVAQGVRARGAPLHLARYGGQFYEVYLADDDHSYSDAVIVGQQLWRRNLVTDDSAQVFTDTTVDGIARWYAREHPQDHPLEPDEDPSDEPHVDASSELDVLNEHGPFLSVEYRADLTVSGSEEWHVARRAVIDLRHGHQASLVDLFGERNAAYLTRRGESLFTQTLDSVLASRDQRAREAAEALGDFEFDSTSFGIVSLGGDPAVAFVAPGRGSRAGGLTLPLPPIRVAAPPWWSSAQDGTPDSAADSSVARWRHGAVTVVARPAALTEGEGARLAIIDSSGRSWPVSQLPAMPRRIWWLDTPEVDSTTLRALARAFDEAALYSEDVRTAMIDPTPNPASGTGRPARPVRASQHETSELMMPQDANNLGHVFGGIILSMMDRAAAVAAIRHARGACVTVSVDRVDFREPIHVGDLVVMKSSVNFAGRTSMEVGVRVEAENLIEGVRRHTNSCYLTFVAIDANGRPVEVPEVIPETDVERRRFAAAQERRRRRLEERTAEEM